MRHSKYQSVVKRSVGSIFSDRERLGWCRLKCMVQNHSNAGAKLAFHAVTHVHAEFTLNVFLTSKEIQYLTRPRWRRHRLFGVEFVRRH